MKDKTDQSHWVSVIKKKTFLNEEALWEDLKKINFSPDINQSRQSSAPPGKRVDTIERKVYGIILWQREQKPDGIKIENADLERRAKEIFKERLEELEKIFEKEKELLLFETESYYNNKTNLEKDIDELLVSLEEEYLKQELSLAMINLQKAEQKKESGEVLKYLEECQRITQRINTIKTIKNAYEKQ
jgi:hypothetical protein